MENLFIYTYVQHGDELELALLEQRAFFNQCSMDQIIVTNVDVDPSRSPFMREQLKVLATANNLEELTEKVSLLYFSNLTFKVISLNDIEFGSQQKIPHQTRRTWERTIGLAINGEPDLDHPNREFGIMLYNDTWYFGELSRSVSVWRHHKHKPQGYSTALSTRVARAIANIAAPKIEGIRMIDPCCGIGTVVVEALSMGMNIVGRDVSPFVCMGARKNIAHFGYNTTITKGPIQEVTEQYDVAIIDLPYNVFTAASREEQKDIIFHAARIASKLVIVTIENIDDILEDLNLTVMDRGIAKKQSFKREIIVCE